MAEQNALIDTYERTKKVMIVCDRKEAAARWRFIVQENNLESRVETNLDKANNTCLDWTPDLIAMDLQLSYDETLKYSKQIRAVCSTPLLIFLPAYNEEQVLELYAVGANECLIKPVSPELFFAKVMAWLRSTETFFTSEVSDLSAGGLTLLSNNNSVCLPGGKTISLTNLEFRLLYLLMSRPGQVFEARRIVSAVWGLYGKEDTTMLKHVIYRLRRKIEPDNSNPRHIQTVPGRGYYFQAGE